MSEPQIRQFGKGFSFEGEGFLIIVLSHLGPTGQIPKAFPLKVFSHRNVFLIMFLADLEGLGLEVLLTKVSGSPKGLILAKAFLEALKFLMEVLGVGLILVILTCSSIVVVRFLVVLKMLFDNLFSTALDLK